MAPTRPMLLAGALAAALAAPAAARAQSAATTYRAADGSAVAVSFSSSVTPDPALAQAYVTFLGTLPHGSELSKLRVMIAPAAEVQQICGGAEGVLACYSAQTHTMTVPDQPLDASTDGLSSTGNGEPSTQYIIAHEYGHHVAAYRENDPFESVGYGPKYWASAEQVCLGVLNRRYFPGNEAAEYRRNPGEAWADTYAHLTFPDVPWRFASSLAPSAASLAAARRDVLTPWTHNVARTFTGRFTGKSSNARHFTFRLTLDGRMTVALKGPSGTDYNLALVSHGKVEQRTSTAGSRDTISYADGACRETPTETITLSVSRKHGSGPFSVRVSYPG